MRLYDVTLHPMPVNGEPGIIARTDGRLLAVIAFETKAGRVSRIHGIANTSRRSSAKGSDRRTGAIPARFRRMPRTASGRTLGRDPQRALGRS
jgi:hypothetical protein